MYKNSHMHIDEGWNTAPLSNYLECHCYEFGLMNPLVILVDEFKKKCYSLLKE